MLAFSNVLSQYGSYLRENQPVVIVGRLSLRDDKDPQIVVNRARPMSDFAAETPVVEERSQTQQGTLYIRLSSEEDPAYRKVKAIINMFPGETPARLVFADTGKRLGTKCLLGKSLVDELVEALGKDNVIIQ